MSQALSRAQMLMAEILFLVVCEYSEYLALLASRAENYVELITRNPKKEVCLKFQAPLSLDA